MERFAIDISPSVGMMEVIGHSGYTFDFAIADLIDNCIAANCKNITLYFDPLSKKSFLYLLDDGDGMSREELRQAAVIGFKSIEEYRASTDLGRFSTGLKSATKSFCNKITIVSKRMNLEPNAIEIDYAHMAESKKWEAFVVEDCQYAGKINGHGTIVVCENFINEADFSLNKTFLSTLNNLEQSLSHIFGKFLINEDLHIFINVNGSKPREIEGWNPFTAKDDLSTKKVYDKEVKYKGETIGFKAYVLPTFGNLSKDDQIYVAGRGLLEQEGFYIYRNKRLIQEGGWLSLDGIGLDDKSKYARIDVSIPSTLDMDFQINFSKNSLIVPKELEFAFMEVAKKARNESRHNFNYQKHPEFKKKLKQENVRIWNETNSTKGMILSVNQNHPLIKELSKDISQVKLKALLNLLSKSLPISMIQSQQTTTVSYTENEIDVLLDDFCEKLKNEGRSISDIKKAIKDTEPFKDYIDTYVISYFNRLEGDDDDK